MIRGIEARTVVLGAVLGAALAATFHAAIASNSYNLWGAVLVVPAVVLLDVAIIYRLARGRGGDPWLSRMLELALLARLFGTIARYSVSYVFYGGSTDAQRYNLYAAYQYRLWRDGLLVWDPGGKQGTQWMEIITTAVYTVIGPSTLAAFFVFGSFAFWGTYLMYRAFVLAIPDGDRQRFALLIFFLPSLLYWPSSIGKEAWLTFFVGVTAYGAARFFTSRSWGIVLLALGAAGTTLIRPHVAVLLFAALLVAQFFRPARTQRGGFLAKFAALGVFSLAAYVLASQSATFLGIDDFSYQAVADSVGVAGEQASQGGSAFTPVSLSSPFGIPIAVVTVLFRPFPFETTNPAMLVQSTEGLVLMILVVRWRPRIATCVTMVRSNPFVSFCVVYVGAFIIAFAGFGNFGILARQRVLMLPFFLVLLALPRVLPARDGLTQGRSRPLARA